jgi:hypothetical protein
MLGVDDGGAVPADARAIVDQSVPEAGSDAPQGVKCPPASTPTPIFDQPGADIFTLVGDASYVYTIDDTRRVVWSIPKCGGTARQTAPASAGVIPDPLAATGVQVCWADHEQSGTSILCGGVGATTPSTIASASGIVSGLAADSSSVVFLGSGGLWSAPIGGGAPQSLYVGPLLGGGLALGATYVFVSKTDIGIFRLPRTGGALEPLWMMQGQTAQSPSNLAVDGTYVYWVTSDGSVVEVDQSDGTAVVLATTTGPAEIALDDANVYLADEGRGVGEGSVESVSKSGGAQPPSVIAPANNPGGIFVDDQSVYWVEFPDTVMRIDK